MIPNFSNHVTVLPLDPEQTLSSLQESGASEREKIQGKSPTEKETAFEKNNDKKKKKISEAEA